MQFVKAFIAGFLATLIFHQGTYALFWWAGAVPNPPFAMAPTWPLEIPSVLSLAFWGGVWGIPIWLLIRNAAGGAYWLGAIILGAVGPSALALFVVFPLKGQGMAAHWNETVIVGALLLNGAWGLGLALLMRLMGQRAPQRGM